MIYLKNAMNLNLFAAAHLFVFVGKLMSEKLNAELKTKITKKKEKI
jgi:hypothetical protein